MQEKLRGWLLVGPCNVTCAEKIDGRTPWLIRSAGVNGRGWWAVARALGREGGWPRGGLCPREVRSLFRERDPFCHPLETNTQARTGKSLHRKQKEPEAVASEP